MAEPVYGEGLFLVSKSGTIWYIIVFEYADDEEYAEIARDRERKRAEEERLRLEMQKLMDEERVIVNGIETRCNVLRASISVSGNRSYVTFISKIPFEPRRGLNIYENMYEPTVAEYDYTVYWIVEDGRVESPGDVEILEGVAVISVRKGARIDGYESVVFKLG
ncbi:MAG: hypothetical protein QXF57_03575 [Acidilobaceae archaeon]